MELVVLYFLIAIGVSISSIFLVIYLAKRKYQQSLDKYNKITSLTDGENK